MNLFQVCVYIGGWLFKSEPLSERAARHCIQDFVLRNPLAQCTIVPAEVSTH